MTLLAPLLAAAGVGLGLARLVATPDVATGLAAGVSRSLAAFTLWFLGPPFRLAGARGRRLLIVCYRGI